MNDKSYTNWQSMSDTALSSAIGAFIKHHRLQQNQTQQDIAQQAGISRSTLSLLERGETVTLATLIQVLRVLNLLHIMDVFKIQQQISPIKLAKIDKQKRQRASSKSTKKGPDSDW